MAKKKYYSRKFLNKSSGMAAIEINAGYSEWNFDCTVSLSDCNRRIDLDFSMWGAKNVKEKLDKLNLVINELTNFKTYLDTATKDFIELNTNHNKDKKKTLLSILDEELDEND